MEEEYGRLNRCGEILSRGLDLCKQNQPLLNKAIRHEEKSQNMRNARHLMSGLRLSSVENSWKTMLEGALMEGRDGQIDTARCIFEYLIENVSWYVVNDLLIIFFLCVVIYPPPANCKGGNHQNI